MSAIQKMIDSRFPWLLAVCVLSLCLAVPALGTAASSANPVAGGTLRISSFIDDPDILFPKPPPPPPPALNTAVSSANPAARADDRIRLSSLIDDPDILFPKPPPPPPPAYQRMAAMERTA